MDRIRDAKNLLVFFLALLIVFCIGRIGYGQESSGVTAIEFTIIATEPQDIEGFYIYMIDDSGVTFTYDEMDLWLTIPYSGVSEYSVSEPPLNATQDTVYTITATAFDRGIPIRQSKPSQELIFPYNVINEIEIIVFKANVFFDNTFVEITL